MQLIQDWRSLDGLGQLKPHGYHPPPVESLPGQGIGQLGCRRSGRAIVFQAQGPIKSMPNQSKAEQTYAPLVPQDHTYKAWALNLNLLLEMKQGVRNLSPAMG